MVKEARRDPGGFVGGEVAEAAMGLIMIPIVIALAGLILFFILGFTTLLGGPMLFFKILFVIGVFVSLILYMIIRPILRIIRRGAKRAVDAGVRTVRGNEKHPLGPDNKLQ